MVHPLAAQELPDGRPENFSPVSCPGEKCDKETNNHVWFEIKTYCQGSNTISLKLNPSKMCIASKCYINVNMFLQNLVEFLKA